MEKEVKEKRDEIRSLKRKIDELEFNQPSINSRTSSQRPGTNEDSAEVKAELEKLKKQLAAETKAKEELQEQLNAASSRRGASERDVGRGTRELDKLQRDLDDANKRHKETEKEKQEALDKVRELEAKVREEKRLKLSIEDELDTLKRAAQRAEREESRASSRRGAREDRETQEKLERLEKESKEWERKYQEERKAKDEERRKRTDVEDEVRRLERERDREKRRESYSSSRRRPGGDDESEKKLAELTQEVEKLKAEKDTLAKEAAQTKAELEEESRKRKEEEEKSAELEEDITDMEKKIKSLMEKVAQASQASAAPATAAANNPELEKTVEKLKKQNEQLKNELTILEGDLEEVEKKSAKADKEKKVMQKGLDEMEEENERLRREKMKLKKEVETLLLDDSGGSDTKVSVLMAEVEELKEKLELEAEERTEAEALHKQEMQLIEDEKLELESELATLKKKVQEDRAKLQEEIEQLEEQRDKLLKEVKALKSGSGAAVSASPTQSPHGSQRGASSGCDEDEKEDDFAKEKTVEREGSGRESAVGKSSPLGRGASSRASKEPKKPEKPQKKVLIQLKGKNRIHVRQVELSSKTLNKADVFILDLGDRIYDWNGAAADRKKREKGVEVANRLSEEKRKRAVGKIKKPEIIILEDGHMEPPKDFWDALGGRPDSIPTAPPGDDEKMEKQWEAADKLYRVNPGNELFPIDSKFTKAKLDTKFNFIFDCHEEMYYWCGKATDKNRREENMKKAKELFAKKTDRPKWSTLKKINEGMEPVLFQEKFHQWFTTDSRSSKRASSRAPAHRASPAAGNEMREEGSVDQILKEYEKTYTHQQLKDGDYPASLDTTKKEAYLSEAEFQSVLGMSKAEFKRQPKWKQDHLKKEKELF